MQIDLLEKILLLRKERICLIQKFLHHLSRTGTGGIDSDDKIPDLPDLLVLQRLDQRNISIAFHSESIVDIVELFRVDLNIFPHGGEFSQESRVIVLIAIDLFDALQHRIRSLAPFFEDVCRSTRIRSLRSFHLSFSSSCSSPLCM